MSDDTYALVMLFTTLASAVALYLKISVARRQRKLMRELLPQLEAKGLWPPATEAKKRATEQLELADRLLQEVSSIGVWTKSDDSSDNRRKRKLLQEVEWAVADAKRSLAVIQHPMVQDLAAAEPFFESLPDHVKEWMADNDPKVASLVSEARRQLDALRERLKSSL